ncbi:MAG: ATP-grasp domain-containing protein [Bacillota bacterium]|nr:ATP-grasp domain-containing protein [Bacillota bacterium]
MNAVVTDVQYRMTLALIRDLADGGIKNITAVCRKGQGAPVGFYSKHVSNHILLTEKAEMEYAKHLSEVCKKIENPVLLCPGRDTISAVSKYPELFKDIAHLVPTEENLNNANDKSAVIDAAVSAGVPVPKSYTLDDAEYPCVIKYRCGEKLGKKANERYSIINNRESLIKTYNEYLKLDSEPVLQEYIEGDGFGVSLVMDKEQNAVDFISHRRVRQFPSSGGPSTCCETYFNENMVNDAVRLLKKIGFTGVAMVEFKGTDDNYRLMEINPRVWGSYALARACNSSFSMSWFNASAGERLKPADLTKPNYSLGVKMQFFPSELKLLNELIRNKRIGESGIIIKDLLNPKVRDGVIEFSDISASLHYIKSLVSGGDR